MMVRKPLRPFFYLLAWVWLALGVLGIFLPILPTTPFALLAAWCFSKSSEKWHQWLISTPHLGPVILDWEKHGVIGKRAKLLACSCLILLFSYTLIFVNVSLWVKIFVSLIGVSVLVFILTRPSDRKENL
jgi:uncharacterized membrane protein YbaN (DUF454 family)